MTMRDNATLADRYRIERSIARGGMADVYLAFDAERQARVAIKVLREDLAEDPDFIRRFALEAEALAKLDHPNIVRFYGFEQDGATAFIVMDFVDGPSLRRQLFERKGPLPVAELTPIVRDLCGALHYAHRKGFTHRDIKPANVMLKRDGTALLADFGIARAVEGATMTVAAVGTPAYMSPEQIEGRRVDARSDIYSFGVMLFELATGRRPFLGEEPGLTGVSTTHRLIEAHLQLPPPDPRSLNRSLPSAAAAVILQALAKRPEDRWQDATSLRAAWDAAVGAGETVVGPGPAGQTERLDRRYPERSTLRGRGGRRALLRGVLVGAVAVMLVAVAGVAWLARAPGSRPAEVGIGGPTATHTAVARGSPTATGVLVARAEPALGGPTQAEPTATAARATRRAGGVQVATGIAMPLADTPTLAPTMTPRPTYTPTLAPTITLRPTYTPTLAPTVTPKPTDTPTIEPTPLPPTAPPTAAMEFTFISLQDWANANLRDGYINPPLGRVSLGGVPFDLQEGQSVTTDAETLPNNPMTITYSANITSPMTVYLLLTGGNLYNRYVGDQVGEVQLIFDGDYDGKLFSVPIIAGQNLREWKQSEGVVSAFSSFDMSEVWRGVNRFDSSAAVIDMLTLNVPAVYRPARLTNVILLDQSWKRGARDPAINLLGLTVLAGKGASMPPVLAQLPPPATQAKEE